MDRAGCGSQEPGQHLEGTVGHENPFLCCAHPVNQRRAKTRSEIPGLQTGGQVSGPVVPGQDLAAGKSEGEGRRDHAMGAGTSITERSDLLLRLGGNPGNPVSPASPARSQSSGASWGRKKSGEKAAGDHPHRPPLARMGPA